jgi:WD40 repeat protein
MDAQPLMGASAIAAGIGAGNINLPQSAETRELLALSKTAQAVQAGHAELLLKLEAQRRVRTVNAPTDSEAVKLMLRERGHPITLFGEGAIDRRLRLQLLLAEAEVASAVAAEGVAKVAAAAVEAAGGSASSAAAVAALAAGGSKAAAALASSSAAPKPELFYTPGCEALAGARGAMAAFSFKAAAARLAREAASEAAVDDALAARLFAAARACRPLLSVIADERPLSACALAPDGSVVAVGSWGPVVRIFDPSSTRCVAALKGHRDRVGCLAWHPQAGLGQALVGAAERAAGQGGREGWVPLPSAGGGGSAAAAGMLVSASMDGTARLWRLPVEEMAAAWGEEEVPDGVGSMADAASSSSSSSSSSGGASLSSSSREGRRKALLESGVREAAVYSGHVGRLSCIAFHPSGDYFATTGFDKTWRLWDVATSKEILLQEVRCLPSCPHSYLFQFAFLSTYSCSHSHSHANTHTFTRNTPSPTPSAKQGHAREVYPIAFHPDGSLVATGDLSGLGRVWDLRSGKSIFNLRGHGTQLLALDWSPNGFTCASGGGDATSLVWELRQQRVLYTLPAHTGLISRVKFSPSSGEVLATASYDGSVKTWCTRDWSPLNTLRGHDGKVTGLDVFFALPGTAGRGEAALVTAGYDRTLKVWG